jgi:hypothetical protein
MLGLALLTGAELKQLTQSTDEKLIRTRVTMSKQAARSLERKAAELKLSPKRCELIQVTIRKDRSYCAQLLRAMRQGLGFFAAHDAAWTATHKVNAGGGL